MMRGNPQLSAIALLVRKYGTKIESGGYEVKVTHEEMKNMSPHGTFQEVQVQTGETRWQYFPNPTIEGELTTPKSVTPNSITIEAKLTEEGQKVFNGFLRSSTNDDGSTT